MKLYLVFLISLSLLAGMRGVRPIKKQFDIAENIYTNHIRLSDLSYKDKLLKDINKIHTELHKYIYSDDLKTKLEFFKKHLKVKTREGVMDKMADLYYTHFNYARFYVYGWKKKEDPYFKYCLSEELRKENNKAYQHYGRCFKDYIPKNDKYTEFSLDSFSKYYFENFQKEKGHYKFCFLNIKGLEDKERRKEIFKNYDALVKKLSSGGVLKMACVNRGPESKSFTEGFAFFDKP